jgi:hypothetical protein
MPCEGAGGGLASVLREARVMCEEACSWGVCKMSGVVLMLLMSQIVVCVRCVTPAVKGVAVSFASVHQVWMFHQKRRLLRCALLL